MDVVHDAERLKELQALPLNRKIQITQTRIIEWYQHYSGNVCISFSGGKDSTVLLHLARQIYPNIPAVFSNTGLEYASIQRFVRTWDNVDIVVPKMRFNDVVSTYGYPLIGKEVAEAIYYARRLRSQTGNVERERERPAANAENCSVNESHSDEHCSQQENHSHGTHARKTGRMETTRTYGGGRKKRFGNEKNSEDIASITDEKHLARTSRGEWEDWRRRCL